MGKSREKRRRRERKALRRQRMEMFRVEHGQWASIPNPESGLNKPLTPEILLAMITKYDELPPIFDALTEYEQENAKLNVQIMAREQEENHG